MRDPPLRPLGMALRDLAGLLPQGSLDWAEAMEDAAANLRLALDRTRGEDVCRGVRGVRDVTWKIPGCTLRCAAELCSALLSLHVTLCDTRHPPAPLCSPFVGDHTPTVAMLTDDPAAEAALAEIEDELGTRGAAAWKL